MRLNDPLIVGAFWSIATILSYIGARRVHRFHPSWWTSPLALTPAFLLACALLLRTGYQDYIRGTHWLLAMLGPATVAFAVPIYEQRRMIRQHWPILGLGVLAGSTIAMTSAWILASSLGLTRTLELSLLPRSMSTPFAIAVSSDLGGIPDLTAIFVVVTGLCGAALGDLMLSWLPLRSSLARGALFGMAAHGAGVAKAHQIGSEEGSIAGLVMVLAGLFNVLMAPLLAHLLAA